MKKEPGKTILPTPITNYKNIMINEILGLCWVFLNSVWQIIQKLLLENLCFLKVKSSKIHEYYKWKIFIQSQTIK